MYQTHSLATHSGFQEANVRDDLEKLSLDHWQSAGSGGSNLRAGPLKREFESKSQDMNSPFSEDESAPRKRVYRGAEEIHDGLLPRDSDFTRDTGMTPSSDQGHKKSTHIYRSPGDRQTAVKQSMPRRPPKTSSGPKWGRRETGTNVSIDLS